MKVNPQLSPYRPAPQQYLPPAKPKATTEAVAKPAKTEPVDAKRLSAEEKLRQVIAEKQAMMQDVGVDGIGRAPELGKLLDLRA